MGVINNLIYFDNNATTRMDERVAEAMQAAQNSGPEKIKTQAALSLSRLIGGKPSELFFTKGTTDAIHTGIDAIFETYAHKGNHIITSTIEHGEVLKSLDGLKDKGAEVTYLAVDKEGLTDPQQLEAAIKPSTVLVSIMAANNHTGVIQPLEAMSEICKRHGIFFFSDASQFVGKMRCDVTELGVDCMAFGAHKMHGPKEIGALYIKEGTPLHTIMRTKNAGPADPALFAGFAAAADVFDLDHWENSAHISKIKNYVEHQLLDIEGFRINGSTRYRLYNTSNLTFPETKNIRSLADRFKFLSYDNTDLYVLRAMGVSENDIKNTFRFSFGKYNTLEEVKVLVETIMNM